MSYARQNRDDLRRLRTVLWKPILVGLLIVIGFFGILGAWAATARLSGAAIAAGLVSPDSNRKSIQHLEGGIVKEIKVREGSAVTAGTPLVILDATKVRATFEQHLVEAHSRRTSLARLIAQRQYLVGKEAVEEIVFPPDLIEQATTNERVAELIEAEKEKFSAWRSTLESEIELLKQSVKQRTAEMVEMDGQLRAIKTHQLLIREEIASIQGLLEKGYETQKRLREMMRTEAAQQEEEAAVRVRMVTSREGIDTARMQMVQLKAERLDEVMSETVTVRAEIQALREQLESDRDTLARLIVRAPVDGTVMNIQVHTLGGVIAPGGTMMDLVPNQDDMIIDAELSITDIDVVVPGQSAQINLTAYPTRHVPSVSGTVLSVSGDALTKSDTGESYYLTKVSVEPEELERLKQYSDVHLVPGMPVEVLIKTQERTMLDYLVDPIIKSMRRSFRES